jgi:MFS family permease
MSGALPSDDHLGPWLAREWQFVLATFSGSGVGYLGSSAAPVIVQALIDAGLSHQRAGDLGTIELMTLALTSMLATGVVTRVSHRGLAFGGVLLAGLGVALSALSAEYAPMILGRVLLGVGSGAAIAGANAAIAARADAERVFAVIWTLGGGVTAALTIQLPTVVAGGNYPAGFAVLGALCLVAAPFLLWIPPRPAHLDRDISVVSAVAGGEALPTAGVMGASGDRRSGLLGPLSLLVLAGMFTYSVAEQALWQFSYDIAVDHGIPYDQVRYLLGVTTLAGLVGGAIAARVGLRRGRVTPLLIGSLLSLLGRWGYLVATTPTSLALSSLAWGIGFYFVSPYQIGLAAALDRRGRIAVAATGVMNLGYGLGPTLGGRLRQYQLDQGLDTGVLVVAIAGATLISLALLLPAALRLERSGLVQRQHT